MLKKISDERWTSWRTSILFSKYIFKEILTYFTCFHLFLACKIWILCCYTVQMENDFKMIICVWDFFTFSVSRKFWQFSKVIRKQKILFSNFLFLLFVLLCWQFSLNIFSLFSFFVLKKLKDLRWREFEKICHLCHRLACPTRPHLRGRER